MSDFIIDGKQGNRALRMASIKKHDKIPKNQSLGRKVSDSFELDEMLDIVNLINKGLRGEKLPEVSNSKVLSCAERIIRLSGNPDTKERADILIKNLNHKIVTENKKVSNKREGKRLYDDLMNG